MSIPLFLSRARLRTGCGEQLSAIAPALLRGSKGDTLGNAHRILWMLFRARDENEPRDFLWREEKPGHYLILSKRPPGDEHKLFDIETKDYDPQLSPGDRLAFALRANPVVSRKGEGERLGKRDAKGKVRSVRCDIVMDALHDLPKRLKDDHRGESKRAEEREARTKAAAAAWIRAQGERHGFNLLLKPEKENEPFLQATNYESVEIPRLNGAKRLPPASFGVLDFEGLIEVTDPSRFLQQLAEGFGKAKAFGCGLMLIKRAV